MQISREAADAAYAAAKNVYEGKITTSKAIADLSRLHQLNRNSATDYVRNFKSMVEGKEYKRTSNAYSTEYFLQQIAIDYGAAVLAKAINATRSEERRVGKECR